MSEVFDPEKVERLTIEPGDYSRAWAVPSAKGHLVSAAHYLKLLALYREAVKRRDATALNDLARAEFAEGSYEGMPIPEGGSDM